LQKVLATALAVPVIALVVVRALGQRPGVRRLSVIATVLALGAIVAFSSTRPTPASATLPTRETALDPTEFTTEIQTSESPSAAVSVTFPSSMNHASVEQMLRITPLTAVDMSWDATDTLLTVAPRISWKPSTYYTVTVEAGALDASGRPLERRVRAAFLTRPPVTASIEATSLVGAEATIESSFRISFSGPIDESTLDVMVSPAIDGQLLPVAGGDAVAPAFRWVPSESLDPDTVYTLTLGPGLRDADQALIDPSEVTVQTTAAPVVVRFRPKSRSADVGWTQKLSVRFSEPMDHATTEAAWTATEGTTKLSGTFAWAENDTVLVFDPKANLGYGQKIEMLVGTGATSKAGLQLQAASSVTFTTAKKPAPRVTTSGGSSGPSVGAGTWAAVETYYLGLMNCTRTGGWVTSTGACSSPGGRDVAALWIDAGISSNVSRPYAKKLAVNNLCTHFSGGNPGDRLKAAGYTSYIWAENLGCRSGDPYAAVLGSHLFFQSEQSYGGGHYVNLMNAKYDRVGIGVWVSSGRVRLVIDFYHPL
jgi:uncharacterized protein YkwD